MNLTITTVAIFALSCLMHTQSGLSAASDGRANLTVKCQEPPMTTLMRGGVIKGNGGEYITNEQNPWFLGQTPVDYCIRIDETAFSANLDQARAAINEAFKTWHEVLDRVVPFSLTVPFVVAKESFTSLTLSFLEVPCDQPHELEFQLGVMDRSIGDALKYSAKNVVALSYRSHYSDETGRAKGKVWLSPDLGQQRYAGPNPGPGYWTKSYHLINVLTHELGHVFGVRHTEAGFMAEDFPSRMLEFGLDTRVGLSSLISNFILCGKLAGRDGSRAAPAALQEIFGLDLESVREVCYIPYGLAHGHYSLDFFMKDGTTKGFLGDLTSVKDSRLEITGQYVVQTDRGDLRYSPFSFFSETSLYIGQGIQTTPVGRLFMTIDSFQPSTVLLSFGHEGVWHEFFLYEDSHEVREMLKLAQAK